MRLFTSPLIESVECPGCGKHTIVKHDNHQYHCLNCGFHRDLSPSFSSLLERSQPTVQESAPQMVRTLDIAGDAGEDMHPVFFIALAILFGLVIL